MDSKVLILFLMFSIFASFFVIDFAFAQTTNPTLNVLTKNLTPSGNVFVTGSGLEPSSTFVVKLDGTKLGTVSTTPEGTFSQYLNIPRFVSTGDHTITIERGKILQSVKVLVTTSQKIPQYMQENLDAEKSSTRSGGITQQGVGNIPGRQAAESDKITICHVPPGNPENTHTITISKSALETHLAHGDSVGECKEDSKKKAPVAGDVTKEPERETREEAEEPENENLNDKVENEDIGDLNEQESINKDTEKEIKSDT
ncbi:hypothetical protein HY484_04770, partial [Candidatus Woesearchaeota archaeon]|nr:hypothetical protein [Candidatus Woesearchaeota archaeon]